MVVAGVFPERPGLLEIGGLDPRRELERGEASAGGPELAITGSPQQRLSAPRPRSLLSPLSLHHIEPP
jgi:hypothetical protein